MRKYHKVYEEVSAGYHDSPQESEVENPRPGAVLFDYAPDVWHDIKGMRYKLRSPQHDGDIFVWEIYGTWGEKIGGGSSESKSQAKRDLGSELKSLSLHYEMESMRDLGHIWEPGSVKDIEPVYPGETITLEIPNGIDYDDDIFLELSRDWDGYYVKAHTKGGQYETRTYGPFKSRDVAESKGTSAAAAMVGLLMTEDLEIDSDDMEELYENSSRMAKRNPSSPPDPDSLGFAASNITAEALVGTPGDPHEAFRQGIFRGVLIGIDQCGISPSQWWKRRKLRKAAKEASEAAVRKHAESIFRSSVSPGERRPRVTR